MPEIVHLDVTPRKKTQVESADVLEQDISNESGAYSSILLNIILVLLFLTNNNNYIKF